MKKNYPVHGRRRRWWVLWTVGCRCGMDAYPCIVEEMLNSSITSDAVTPDELYASGVAYARWYRNEERPYRWSRDSW